MQPNVGRNFPPRPRGLPPVSQHHPPGHAPPQRQQPDDPNRVQAMRRLAMHPTDREIPDGVDDMVLGDVVQRYKALRDVERNLDAVLINKRLAAKDSGHRYERRLRTMRIWISSKSTEKDTADTRMDDTFDFGDDAGGGSYKVRIEGRLLPDDDDDEDDEEEAQNGTAPTDGTTMDLDKPASSDDSVNKETKEKPTELVRHKFSHYFRSITFTYNRSPRAPPNSTVPSAVHWKKPAATQNGIQPSGADANFDALEFERKVEEGIHSMTITMERADPHGRIRGKVSPALAKILDKEYEDPSGAMMGLYNYVRLRGLEQEGSPQHFRCDDALRAVFGTDTVSFPYAPEEISKNIQPLPEITLPFTIRLSQPTAEPTIYDIPILADDPLEEFTSYFRSSTNPRMDPNFGKRLENIATLDKDIALAIQGMYASKAKISFLNQLSEEPVGFIKKWMSSQQADEEIILAEERSRGPEWNRGGSDSVWNSQSAKESVGLLLAKQKPI